MKRFFFASSLTALAFLTACGNVEKIPAPELGATNQGQKKPAMTDAEFQTACDAKKGSIYSTPTGKICQHEPHVVELDEQAIENAFGSRMIISITVGDVSKGAVLWGESSGGQRIDFFVDSPDHKEPLKIAAMNNSALPPHYVEYPGKLWLKIYRARYEHIKVYVSECFSAKEPSVRCPSPA